MPGCVCRSSSIWAQNISSPRRTILCAHPSPSPRLSVFHAESMPRALVLVSVSAWVFSRDMYPVVIMHLGDDGQAAELSLRDYAGRLPDGAGEVVENLKAAAALCPPDNDDKGAEYCVLPMSPKVASFVLAAMLSSRASDRRVVAGPRVVLLARG